MLLSSSSFLNVQSFYLSICDFVAGQFDVTPAVALTGTEEERCRSEKYIFHFHTFFSEFQEHEIFQ